MENIIFSLTKVSDAITDKTLYRANVQTNGTLGRDELAERLAARTKQDVSLWKYFLDALSDEIGIQLLAGYRINLGQLTTGFAIRGAFMSEDEAFDPAKHQLIATVRTLDPRRSASLRSPARTASSSRGRSSAFRRTIPTRACGSPTRRLATS